jgi:hypothetical protein
MTELFVQYPDQVDSQDIEALPPHIHGVETTGYFSMVQLWKED